MKKVTIIRLETVDDGTFGKLALPGQFECWTAELPWRDNAKGVSCIPPGTYVCRWGPSPSRKNADGTPEWTYRLEGVRDRAGVLIHSGNFAGDRAFGYAADVEGCILLGRAIIDDLEIPEAKRKAQNVSRAKQKGIASSRDTISAFIAATGKAPIEIVIQWAAGVGPKEA